MCVANTFVQKMVVGAYGHVSCERQKAKPLFMQAALACCRPVARSASEVRVRAYYLCLLTAAIATWTIDYDNDARFYYSIVDIHQWFTVQLS